MFFNLLGEFILFSCVAFLSVWSSHYSVSPYTTNAHINIVRMTWHIRCLLISHFGMHMQYNDNNKFFLFVSTLVSHTHTQNNNNTTYVNKCLMRQNTDRVEKIEMGPGRFECEKLAILVHSSRSTAGQFNFRLCPIVAAARKPNKKCT